MKCAVCGTEFTPLKAIQKYCSKNCKWRATYARQMGRPVEKQERLCKRCGANIDERSPWATYCETCSNTHLRVRKKADAPDRQAAIKAARVAMERLKNKKAHQEARVRYGDGRMPLKASTQAAIERVIEKAKENGTCYGSG